jgi:hypothetical protein
LRETYRNVAKVNNAAWWAQTEPTEIILKRDPGHGAIVVDEGRKQKQHRTRLPDNCGQFREAHGGRRDGAC